MFQCSLIIDIMKILKITFLIRFIKNDCPVLRDSFSYFIISNLFLFFYFLLLYQIFRHGVYLQHIRNWRKKNSLYSFCRHIHGAKVYVSSNILCMYIRFHEQAGARKKPRESARVMARWSIDTTCTLFLYRGSHTRTASRVIAA